MNLFCLVSRGIFNCVCTQRNIPRPLQALLPNAFIFTIVSWRLNKTSRCVHIWEASFHFHEPHFGYSTATGYEDSVYTSKERLGGKIALISQHHKYYIYLVCIIFELLLYLFKEVVVDGACQGCVHSGEAEQHGHIGRCARHMEWNGIPAGNASELQQNFNWQGGEFGGQEGEDRGQFMGGGYVPGEGGWGGASIGGSSTTDILYSPPRLAQPVLLGSFANYIGDAGPSRPSKAVWNKCFLLND